MQLIILGMHRSGTSVLARLLNLMGAYFGPEGVSTGANQENPKGFWERRDVRALNDSVLHAVGCDWNRISGFDVSNLPATVVSDFNKRASKLILEMDGHRPWLLKEPRLCLLLSLWRRWLEVPFCIHIYRNPVEVASSLNRRNGIPMEAGIALWNRYLRSAFKDAHGLPSVIVSHRQLMTEPDAAVERLFQQLNNEGVTSLRMPSDREIKAFVQDDLYRERESRDDLQPYLGAARSPLLMSLQRGCLPNEEEIAASDFGGEEEILRRYEASLPPMKQPGGGKMSEPTETNLRHQLELREQELRFVRESAEKYHADVKQRDQWMSRIEGERNLLRERIVQLEADLGIRVKRQAVMDNEMGELQKKVIQLEDDRERLVGLYASADEKLASSLQRSADLEAKLAGKDERLMALQKEAEIAREAADSTGQKLQEEIAKLEARIESHENGLKQLRADLQRKQFEVHLANDAKLKAEQEVEARYGELAKLTKCLIDSEQELTQAQAELDDAQHGFDSLQRNAARTQAELEETIFTMRKSYSWKLTAPMRLVARLIRSSNRKDGKDQDLALLRSSGLFDEKWYLLTYPDVAQSGLDAAEHFLSFGASEERDPGPGFSTAVYMRNNPDVSSVGMNPVLHYISYGKAEGRNPK